jgi:Ca-activated chloride channel family protein
MSKTKHYGKSYSEEQEKSIKCYFISEESSGYRAKGIRREELKLLIPEDKRRSKGLEEGLWYEVEGKITEQDGYNLTLDVIDIECLGESVNDWIFRMNGNVVRNATPQQKQTGTINRFASIDSTESLSSNAMPTGQQQGGMDATMSTESVKEDMSGFATGGGKDIDNFRKNIRNNKLPHPDSISHEGLLYDYEFDVGSREKDALFYPNYEQAVSENPVTGNKERYLTVGLDSGMESFERPPLDLMFVVDISGSMGAAMEQYYYDSPEERADLSQKNKMEATKDVLKNVIQKLNDNDRFGVVLYNQQGIMGKPLRRVSDTDTEQIISEIDDLHESGGTNLSNGFDTAVDEIKEFADIDTENHNRESRIMFMTDAMPNTGETRESQLEKRFKEVADENIYTTFIGIGIDANPDLIDTLTSTTGANHYFIDSVEEFNERIDEEFTYTVTPLVFDLSLTVEGEGFEIDGVYGSPNEDASTSGEVMSVKTLFPSHGDEGTKGGVIAVSMSEAEPGDNVRISTSWTERDGSKGGDVTQVRIVDDDEYYESSDTRKAVALCQYVEQMTSWLEDTNTNSDSFERESTELNIPENHKSNIRNFLSYFESQVDNIEDEGLEKELETLRSITED